ncbi:MAG: hypothetical protein Q8L29_04490 [archaeon]|nr:hypothetical protein [archaeon]
MIISREVLRTAIADVLEITRENKLFTTKDIKKNLGKSFEGYNGTLVLEKSVSQSKKGSLGIRYEMGGEIPIRAVVRNHRENLTELWIKYIDTLDEFKLRIGEGIRHDDGSYIIHYTQYKRSGSADFNVCIRNLRRLEGQLYRDAQKRKRAYRLKRKPAKYDTNKI